MIANDWFPGCSFVVQIGLHGVVRDRQDRERAIRRVRDRRDAALRQLRAGVAKAPLIDRERIESLMGRDT